MDSFSDVFERVKQLCRGEMSEVAYDLWIRELELTALDSSTACLQCTTQFKRDIVNEKYNALLTASFEEIMGFPVQVEITSREAAPAAPAAQENNRLDFQPEKEYSFETFVVGSGNSLAHAAAWAVANNPAKSYNPLFMYGGSGLGKTHLIYAICGKIRQNHPDYKLLYVKGEEFANELILAIRNGTTAEFKEKYRQADLLAVDDIQFIAGKESTQEEFFHTFNSLYECGKQIILTSDRPPKEIKTLEDRLRSPLRVDFGESVIKMSCSTSIGKAYDECCCSTTGNLLEMGFNNRFLLDALKNVDTDMVRLELCGPLSPMKVLPLEGDHFLFLVLPMRLRAE